MENDPNQITIPINGMPVHLTLQARPGSVDFKTGVYKNIKATASSGVDIIVRTDNPKQLEDVKRILLGLNSQNILRQLARRLNNLYFSINAGHYNNNFSDKLDRFVAAITGKEQVILRPSHQQGDALFFTLDLPAIPKETTHADFLTNVRRTLHQIKHEREQQFPHKEDVLQKPAAPADEIPEDQWRNYLENKLNIRNVKGTPDLN